MEGSGSSQDVRHRSSSYPNLRTHPLSLPPYPPRTSPQVTPFLDQLELHDHLKSGCHELPSSEPRRVLTPSLQISVRASASHKIEQSLLKSPYSPPLRPLPAVPPSSSPTPSTTAIFPLTESFQAGSDLEAKKPHLLRQTSCPGIILTDPARLTSLLPTITTSIPAAHSSSSNTHNSKYCRTPSLTINQNASLQGDLHRHIVDSYHPSKDMSFSGFFNKRPRSKSAKEAQPPRIVTAGIASSRAGSVANASTSGTPISAVESHELRDMPQSPAVESHELRTMPQSPARRVGFRGPFSPLGSPTSSMSPRLPPGPPPISPAEIGVKFPTQTYGPGVERRIFLDPFRARPSKFDDLEEATGKSSKVPNPSDRAPNNPLEAATATSSTAQNNPHDLPFGLSIKRAEVTANVAGDRYDKQQTTSLGEWAWTPRGSFDEDEGSLYSGDAEAQPDSSGSARLPPTTQYSHSTEYGNTQNLPGVRASGLPPGQISGQTYARLSVIDQDGSVVSQPLSEAETREVEREIQTHISQSSISIQENRERHDRVGRVSIEYSADPRPGSSQGSSSLGGFDFFPDDQVDLGSGRPPRSGTPPLLFGKRALDTTNVSRSESGQNIRSNGRLAQVLAASRLKSDSRLAKATEVDDEADWVTETGSGNFNRRAVRAVIAQAGVGSSLADNSDSGSLSPSKVTRTSSIEQAEQVVQPPSHARYSQNWNLLQDRQSGNMVLMPDFERPPGIGLYSANVLAPVATRQSTYQHPSPLSKKRRHPLTSSSPLRSSARVAPLFENSSNFEPWSKRSLEPKGEKPSAMKVLDESPLSRAISSGFGTGMTENDDSNLVSKPNTDRKEVSNVSSAWMSTSMSASLSGSSELPDRAGSFAKLTALSAKANLTGTPERMGMRLAGSSLADPRSSSPDLPDSPDSTHSSFDQRDYILPRKLSFSRGHSSHRAQLSQHGYPIRRQLSSLNTSSYPSPPRQSSQRGYPLPVQQSSHSDYPSPLRYPSSSSSPQQSSPSGYEDPLPYPLPVHYSSSRGHPSPLQQSSPSAYHTPLQQLSPTGHPSPIGQFSPSEHSGRNYPRTHVPSKPKASRSAKMLHRRTYDGSMNSEEIRASNDAMSERLRRYPGTRDLSMYDEEQQALLLATTNTNLSPEVRQHRQDLVDHSLLQPLPEPPVTEPRRLSVPLELITKGGSSKMASQLSPSTEMNAGRTSPQLNPTSPGHHIRRRSAHRYSSTGDLVLDVNSDEGEFVKAAPLSPPRLHPGQLTRSSSAQTNQPEPAASETGQGHQAPWDGGPYGNFILQMRGAPTSQLMRPVPRPRPIARASSPHLQRRYNLPVARVESPHLYQPPRLTIDEAEELQKAISRKYLYGLANPFLFFVLLLLGHDLLDGLMAWHTNGEVASFGAREKTLALVFAWGFLAGWVAVVAVVAGLLLE